ncbi:MAG TPA: roadblock/LC7 domain-containing protein [bacterium]|jgi:predicted regulator of Ras-like GTPase activity (Roadblock/LC7/MglB family)|nr:roadblock/LC7 domain-containing protein [bacterium]HNT65164.1 roadblock/LC7 domain-containing protein [bacterium]HOX86308.1 roadblock/LC7 domain-containing protein [bacterium]HPG45863.1 roadblock/LC7 domain-containing protein [bacterium]HPM97910.1 roadblock/LC7 domain-containing protein [bacterium]
MDIQQRHNGKRVVFSEASFQKIRLLIRDFLLRSRASMCIFADVNGYPIAYGGDSRGVQISSLTALAAGSFSATLEMARWLGEEQRFRFIYHEGAHRNLYLSNIGDNYLMIVLFDKSVPLGIIRLLTRQTTDRLNELLNDLRRKSDQATQLLDLEFRDLLDKELDRTFGLNRS